MTSGQNSMGPKSRGAQRKNFEEEIGQISFFCTSFHYVLSLASMTECAEEPLRCKYGYVK